LFFGLDKSIDTKQEYLQLLDYINKWENPYAIRADSTHSSPVPLPPLREGP